jgi:ribonuclease HI
MMLNMATVLLIPGHLRAWENRETGCHDDTIPGLSDGEIEAKAHTGIYRLMCNQQWRPRSTNYGHAKKSRDMEQEPILLMGTDRMTPRYVLHKPFKVPLSSKHKWQNRFNPDNKGGLVWYMDGSKTNEGTPAGVYKWGSRRGHSFSLGLHITVFQEEIYAIKACTMENIEKCYKGRNICILSDSQADIKVLNNFEINSKLVWDCHQSLMRLAEHNRVQLIWVPGHMEIYGNEMADQLTRQDSSCPFIGPQPALGISAKIAREVIRGWTNRKHTEYWQFIHGQRQAWGFLKIPSAKRARDLLSLSRNQLRILTGLFTEHCHLKGHLFKLGLVDSPECDRCKQASETASCSLRL